MSVHVAVQDDQRSAVSETSTKESHVLLVGPLPPPMCGSHVTFQIVCDELARLADGQPIKIVDTSHKKLKKTERIATIGNLTQACRIVREFRKQLRDAEVVLIFGPNGFLASMAPVLVWLAKRANKPVYLRAFGGSLYRFSTGLNPLLRKLFQRTLRSADGLSVQTALLHDQFTPLLGDKVHNAPGLRRLPKDEHEPPRRGTGKDLRLAFVGIVREEKGVFVLLESLRQLRAQGANVRCDFFGPIWPTIADRFEEELPITEAAQYKGVVPASEVIATLGSYDALVLPSHYKGEGHPGVLIEAMIAGIAAVSTEYQSIPELIDHEVNGLLISPHDPGKLTEALRRMDLDRDFVDSMAKQNWHRRRRFDVSRVVPQLLRQMGVNVVADEAEAR